MTYTIMQEIGRGETAVVYLARLQDGALCVVKRLQAGSQKTPATAREAFDREAVVLPMLDHPAIVQLLDRPNAETLILSYIDGVKLLDFFMEDPPIDRVLDYGRQLCDLLAYVHTRGWAFGDVHLSNALVKKDGTVHLIDFGDVAPATPAAIAEDVYGIGACLIRLLTGTHFWAPGWILPDDYVTACNPDVPLALSRILMRAVARLGERYATPAELAAGL